MNEIFGRFILLERIGVGQTAEVFVAEVMGIEKDNIATLWRPRPDLLQDQQSQTAALRWPMRRKTGCTVPDPIHS